MEDKNLDALFALAREAGADRPSEDLMARVLADGLAVQPTRYVQQNLPEPNIWARLWQALGGARLAAGLTVAAVLGLGLGYLDPVGFSGSSGAAYAGEFELIPIAEPFFEEGIE